MNAAVLDIRSKHALTIKSDLGKNFSVVLSGFDNLDTIYTLTLKKGDDVTKVFAVGTDIILDAGLKTLTLVFTGSDYAVGTFDGTLESENKNADTYYNNKIKLIIE